MRGARANGLMAAGLTAFALTAAYRALHAAPDPLLVARWWPATVLVTALFLLLPRQDVRGLTFLTTWWALARCSSASRGSSSTSTASSSPPRHGAVTKGLR